MYNLVENNKTTSLRSGNISGELAVSLMGNYEDYLKELDEVLDSAIKETFEDIEQSTIEKKDLESVKMVLPSDQFNILMENIKPNHEEAEHFKKIIKDIAFKVQNAPKFRETDGKEKEIEIGRENV